MKKTFAALATIATLMSAPVLAQAPAAPATHAAAPAAVDPAMAAAVQKMFAAMKYREVMVGAMQQMIQSLPSQLRMSVTQAVNNNPKMSPADKEKALAKFEKSLPDTIAAMSKLLNDPTLIDDMYTEIVPLYARTFTLSEINELTRFYSTPVGQKMLQKMPQLMGESMVLGQKVVGPRVGKLVQQLMQQNAAKNEAAKKEAAK
jgi:hypothetical protein